MKKLKTILLSAILLAGGCKTLEKTETEEYKRGVREGIQRTGEAMDKVFSEVFRRHLLRDQINLRNLYSSYENLAGRYEQEGNEKEADFYRQADLEARLELSMIEHYFKTTP